MFLKRLRQQIHEKLPGKRIFFIYTHNNGYSRFKNGLKANTEISYWIYRALRSSFPRVTFLKLQDEDPKKIQKITSQDVVIGHIGETFLKASKQTSHLIAFYPWSGHQDRNESKLFNCISFSEESNFLSLARSVIFLTSEYNFKKYVENPENYWHSYLQKIKQKKSVRIVHQPLDLNFFPRIKFEYHCGDFLYIGNDAHMKCLDDSKRLVRELHRRLHIFGVGEKRINHLNNKEIHSLASLCDFFIQPGMWEAQCVSILEAAARGFIPVVSKETGYPYEHPFLLRYNDHEYNLKTLKALLSCSSVEKKNLADSLHRQLIEDRNHNDWKTLTDVIIEEAARL